MGLVQEVKEEEEVGRRGRVWEGRKRRKRYPEEVQKKKKTSRRKIDIPFFLLVELSLL